MNERNDAAMQPPEDRAQNYAVFKRAGQFGRSGREELRIGIAESNSGVPYVSMRVWSQAQTGPPVLFPSRVAVSLRRHELVEAIEALSRIAIDLGLMDPPETPASQWRGYGAPPARPDARVDHTALYAGNGIRRVDLSKATRDAAFDALLPKQENKS